MNFFTKWGKAKIQNQTLEICVEKEFDSTVIHSSSPKFRRNVRNIHKRKNGIFTRSFFHDTEVIDKEKETKLKKAQSYNNLDSCVEEECKDLRGITREANIREAVEQFNKLKKFSSVGNLTEKNANNGEKKHIKITKDMISKPMNPSKLEQCHVEDSFEPKFVTVELRRLPSVWVHNELRRPRNLKRSMSRKSLSLHRKTWPCEVRKSEQTKFVSLGNIAIPNNCEIVNVLESSDKDCESDSTKIENHDDDDLDTSCKQDYKAVIEGDSNEIVSRKHEDCCVSTFSLLLKISFST